MTASDPKLELRVLGWVLVFTLGSACLAALSAPRLLLLSGPAEAVATTAVLISITAGGVVGMVRSAWALRRQRFVLRALTLGSRSIEPYEMQALSAEIGTVTVSYIVPPLVALALFASVLRPATVDASTAISVSLLAAVIVAAGSLPLHVLVRAAFLRAIELADVSVMREVVEQADRRGLTSKRVARRLLASVAAPVAFVALGSALIASAHLRRADERQREEIARALARAALEQGPGVVAGAGVEEAITRAEELGFAARISKAKGDYRIELGEDSRVTLTTPLDAGSARVRFSASTVPVLSTGSLLIALFAATLAGALGIILGRALSHDLASATAGVRALAEGRGPARLVRASRFRAVLRLGRAIERLAARFEVFARAQRKAIESREAATRMRGLFFASVSHDLKSPLNAILGFTELVRLEPLTRGLEESLDLIERSGRELLALIETILDAARVEAGQLELVREPVNVNDLFGQAIDVGRSLGGDSQSSVVGEIAEQLPRMHVDRVRITRAIGTFLGHALRSSSDVPVRMKAGLGAGDSVRFDIRIESDRASAHQLDAMLDPSRRASSTEPRGLALGIALARSMIELHGGRVSMQRSPAGSTLLCVEVPIHGDDSKVKPTQAFA